ncbi:MAG TPA: zinc finger domain-containing protein [Micromonosporaceae bacterium]
MPEGDTVWKTARVLHAALAGRELIGSDFRVPKLATVDLAGWRVEESTARGKHLLLRLEDPRGRRLTLHSHLRMDGAWRVYRAGDRWRGGPAHTIRVVLRSGDAVAVGYHLHDLALVPTADEHRLVGHLGPDLLGADWDPDEAVRRLRQRPDRAIAEALLDQRNLAGIGNLYKSEVLFLRGISPWAPVATVDDLPALVALAHRMLDANRDRWSQVTTGSDRTGRQTYVFERAGAPCRRCGTMIRRAGQGDRVTYWCPTCQPGTTPAGTVRPTLARD